MLEKITIGTVTSKLVSMSVSVWKFLAYALGTSVLILLLFALLSTRSDVGSQDIQLSKKVLHDGGDDVIAAVYLSGVISEEESTAFGSDAMISSNSTVELLEALTSDVSVKAVVLHINSPGGSAVASDEIYTKVRELREVKPVVARLSDVAASGGYYIAAGADKIVANQATLTGSIGVISQIPDLSGLFDKLGVNLQTVKTGEFKDIGSPSRALSEAELTIFQSAITDAFDQFVLAIADGRGMPEDVVRTLADGRFYSGKQAKEAGLVDELGTSDDAYELAAELAQVQDYSVVKYSQGGFLSSLLSTRFRAGMLGVLGSSLSSELVGLQKGTGILYLAPQTFQK